MSFLLHPQLARDCLVIGELPVSTVLLMNNRHFPWIVLVPRRNGARELFELEPYDYKMVMSELQSCARAFAELTGAHKMNIAALGNIVPQLHIHIVARFTHDAAWPNPVWNSGVAAEAYASQDGMQKVVEIQAKLGIS